MQIYLKNLQGNTLVIDVESSDTVESLKSKIKDIDGVPADRQRLIYAGRQLEDGKTLADYKMEKYGTVHLVFRMGGGPCSVCGTNPEKKISASIIQENKTVDTIDWNKMVVIKAGDHVQSWEEVGAAMAERFKFAGDFHLQPVSPTRALFCIENTKEREYLFKQQPWVFEDNRFQFVPWSSSINQLSAAEIEDISAKWVLVKGVPFSLWNSEMFNAIGAQCGGLLEVSPFTKFGLNLSAMKLRVKGPLLSNALPIKVNRRAMAFTASLSVAADQSEKLEATTAGRIKIVPKNSVKVDECTPKHSQVNMLSPMPCPPERHEIVDADPAIMTSMREQVGYKWSAVLKGLILGVFSVHFCLIILNILDHFNH